MTAKTYAVKYECSGASSVPSGQTKTYGTNLTLSSKIPTKTGYTFASWSGSDGKTYNAGASYMGNTALTLTCKMNLNSYKCSAGNYLIKGKTSCLKCSENNYCVGGTYYYNTSKNQGITACPSGTTSSAGSDSKSDCHKSATVLYSSYMLCPTDEKGKGDNRCKDDRLFNRIMITASVSGHTVNLKWYIK